MVKDFDFTNDTRCEFDALINNKENAFDLLIKNQRENGLTDIDSTKIVARLQTQYIAENRKEGDLRTKEDWDQKEYYEPNEVNDNIPMVTKDRYSSFALIKVDDATELEFPLNEDFSSIYEPFERKSYSDVSLAKNMHNIVQKLGITIKQNDFYKFSVYKHNFINRAIVKIKSTALRLMKKPAQVAGQFSGKISLKTKYNNYNVSNVEKITKIYDFILGVAIKAKAKTHKDQMGGLSKEIKYVARLFADILMARVNDLGDINNNKKLEKCLWLQFANALNKYSFDSFQLKVITELGTQATVSTCKSLGITKEKIIERMSALGYMYTCVPSNEEQALTGIKQKDFSIYTQINAEEKTEDSKMFFVEPETIVSTQPTDDTYTSDTEVKNTSFKKDVVESGERTQVKKSTIEKMIDKSVIKFLADRGTIIAEKINTSKVKGKKLQDAEVELNLYNLMLSYYVQATNAKPMSVKNDGDYNENEISKAKVSVKALIIKRNEVTDKILSHDSQKGEQSSASYINSVCKSLCNNSVRNYFIKLIKECVAYCKNYKFDENKDNASQNKEIDNLLESANQFLTNLEQTKENTTYVPNFVVVDEGVAPKSTLKPNFIIVDEGEPPKSLLNKDFVFVNKETNTK